MSVTIFTDGNDNCEGSICQVEEQIDKLKSKTLPKTFTLGFGQADADSLTKIANITGGPYIALKSINDFRQIEKHLDEFKNERELIKFACKLVEGRECEYTLPITLNASVYPVNIILPLTEETIEMHCERSAAIQQLIIRWIAALRSQ